MSPSAASTGRIRRVRTALCLALGLLATSVAAADAGQTKTHARRDARVYDRAPDDAWRPFGGVRERRAYAPDTPYGPRYQTQEQEQQSMYDFSTGKRGNMREYWWRE